MLYKFLNKEPPETLFVGKINFIDMKVKCSLIRPEIKKGNFSGWDDIRLPFLAALKKRGYQSEAFVKYAIDVGITQNDKSTGKIEYFKAIDSFNTEIIDPKSNRYFIIREPVEIKIQNAPEQTISINLHPDFPKKGQRTFKTKDTFYIEKQDLSKLQNNKIYRLMDCINFQKKGDKFVFHSKDYETYKKFGKKIIHWLPKQEDIAKVEILMPDNTKQQCIGESLIKKLKPNAIIQAERFGFMRLDEIKNSTFKFWFTHN